MPTSSCDAKDKKCLQLEAAWKSYNESCRFEESAGPGPLLGPAQIIFLVVMGCLLIWHLVATHLDQKRKLIRKAEGHEEEDAKELAERRSIASKVVFLDFGNGGPVDVWMWLLTKLPLLALAGGVLLPAYLSWEGLHQAMCINGATGKYPCDPGEWGTPMNVDMDFAGYVKTETKMQLYQDALSTAESCPGKLEDIEKLMDPKKNRRLLSGLPNEDFIDSPFYDALWAERRSEWLSAFLQEDEGNVGGQFDSQGANASTGRRSLAKRPVKYLANPPRSKCTHPTQGVVMPCGVGQPPYWKLRIFYEAADDSDPKFGVFSKARLEEIRMIEAALQQFPGYNDFDMANCIFYQCWKFDGYEGEC
jgi:hypothetical protein